MIAELALAAAVSAGPAVSSTVLDGVPVHLRPGTEQVVTVNHGDGYHAHVTYWKLTRTGWVARFSAEVQARTGRAPYIYTPQGWWNPCTGGSAAMRKDPLWVPNYTTASSPAMPSGWTTWQVWQYTSTGTVPGIHDPGFTDLDRLRSGVKSLGS